MIQVLQVSRALLLPVQQVLSLLYLVVRAQSRPAPVPSILALVQVSHLLLQNLAWEVLLLPNDIVFLLNHI